jgi:hypothetical protein
MPDTTTDIYTSIAGCRSTNSCKPSSGMPPMIPDAAVKRVCRYRAVRTADGSLVIPREILRPRLPRCAFCGSDIRLFLSEPVGTVDSEPLTCAARHSLVGAGSEPHPYQAPRRTRSRAPDHADESRSIPLL